jgi:hypothetical protein
MSSKQAAIELIEHLPDDVTWPEILTALQDHSAAAAPTPERPPPSTDEYTLDELTDDEWALFVAQGLADELSDPREDVYTPEHGTPSHDAG